MKCVRRQMFRNMKVGDKGAETLWRRKWFRRAIFRNVEGIKWAPRPLISYITFFYYKSDVEYFILQQFFPKETRIFRGNREKSFLGALILLTGEVPLIAKMNITFFMRNKVFNISSNNNFFEKQQYFPKKKREK